MKKDDAHDERDGQDADGNCRANDRVFVHNFIMCTL